MIIGAHVDYVTWNPWTLNDVDKGYDVAIWVPFNRLFRSVRFSENTI